MYTLAEHVMKTLPGKLITHEHLMRYRGIIGNTEIRKQEITELIQKGHLEVWERSEDKSEPITYRRKSAPL